MRKVPVVGEDSLVSWIPIHVSIRDRIEILSHREFSQIEERKQSGVGKKRNGKQASLPLFPASTES
jgi:hypothetical protein